MTGKNTYSGITTINAGVLSISQDTNLGTPPSAPVANQLTLNGGTLEATASFDSTRRRNHGEQEPMRQEAAGKLYGRAAASLRCQGKFGAGIS